MRMLIGLVAVGMACAQGRGPVKPVPPAGVDVAVADRQELESGLERLKAAAAKLKGNPLLPDVLIYQEAVRYAVQYNEFFKPEEVAKAKTLLKEGEERARLLAEGQSPW